MKLFFTRASLIAVGLVLTFLLGETLARLYFLHTHSVNAVDFRSVPSPHRLGWQGTQSIGDLTSTRPRILVVGDSMTTPLLGVQRDEMYYALLGRLLNVEIFAYGGQGFGTLQEAMVIEQYVPIVKPDLVVLQVCWNDFVNNSWELESRSLWNNNLMTRPYLEPDGRIRYRFPSRYADYGPVLRRSRLVYVLAAQAAKATAAIAAMGLLYSTEIDFLRGTAFPPLERSVKITEQIIGDLRARLGSIPLVAFASDIPAFWPEIFDKYDVPFYEGVLPAIEAEESRLGTLVRPDGAHWNAQGHRVVGEALAQWIADHRRSPRL